MKDVLELETLDGSSQEEEFSTPIDLSDILTVCRHYNKMGWQVQGQIDSLLELGVEESIRSGTIRVESLTNIKEFLNSIVNVGYFGDAGYQATECMRLINQYEAKNSIQKISSKN